MKVVPRNLYDRSRSSFDSCKVRSNIKRAKSVASPFVVPLNFYFETESNRYFFVDFLSGGELLKNFHDMALSFKEDWVKFYIAEILCGLEYFHDLGIFDVNLKPRNILLDPRGHVTVSKFNPFIDKLPTGMTKELLTGDPTEPKTGDFWTIGVLAFNMLCGYRVSSYIPNNFDRFLPRGINPQTTNFIKELLNPNPETRLGAKNGVQDLIAHPWFAEIDWERLRKKLVKPPIGPEFFVNMPRFNPEPSDSSIISTKYNESAVMSNEPWNGLKNSILPVRAPLIPPYNSAMGKSQRSSDTSSKFSYDSVMGNSRKDFDTSSEISNDSALVTYQKRS